MTNTYNTRRKSLSLEALGVQVPGVGRAHAHRSSVDLKTNSAQQQQQPPARPQSQSSDAHDTPASPPAKRIKRSHSPPATTSPTSQRPSSAGQAQTKSQDKPAQAATPAKSPQGAHTQTRHVEYTPPPSPPAEDEHKIDYGSINDDICEGVVRQLEKTGNRPHLIKELAAVLSTTHDSVTSSANAPALLSSRLANYMKRPCWNSSNPCPVGKELIPIHPRKVFYYLTDRTRQDLPPTSEDIYAPLGITSPTRVTPPAATPTTAGVGVMGPPSTVPAKRPFAPSILGASAYNVSPPLSNASIAEDESESISINERGRFAMSPSPEVDLSIHNTDYEHGEEEQAIHSQIVTSAIDNIKREFPTPPTDASSQSSYTSARSSMARDDKPETASRTNSGTRHQSPPLEGDEHAFMGTARSFRERSSGSNTPAEAPADVKKTDEIKSQEHANGDGRDELFTQQPHKEFTLSSPAFQPQSEVKHQAKATVGHFDMDRDVVMSEGLYRWDLDAVTDIGVDDLDSLLSGCLH